MIIDGNTLDLVLKGFKTVYTDAYMNVAVHWDKVTLTLPSVSRDETYGWLGQFPQLRKWIGPRHVHKLKAHSFKIANRKFESTISIDRDDLSDDRLGIFKPEISEMGHLARQHPEELIFGLLAAGFTSECFDGQNYFDTDHPQTDSDGAQINISNTQAGAGPGWYLLDTSRAVRPIVWQERESYDFQSKTSPTDDSVFLNDEYLYGVRARVNAGFGLWQLAYGSKADLTPENYALARAAMMDFRSDGGRILGINPTTLVVPPALESDALHVVNTELTTTGGSNPWKDTAELVVTPLYRHKEMSNFATAICDRQLPDKTPSENTPQWVHLFPNGVMTGRDGRTFNLADPQRIVQAFEAGNIDLPIDYEHQHDKREKQASGPIPAAGWIKELKVKADGLWGRVEWTAQASELLGAKAYRYLSPSFLYQKTGKVITKLKGAGLVHNPNLQLTALASQEATMKTFIERLAALLKLSPDTAKTKYLQRLRKSFRAQRHLILRNSCLLKPCKRLCWSATWVTPV